MQSQEKFIGKIKVCYQTDYLPNKLFTSFELLQKLKVQMKGLYDLKIIEVSYIVQKSKTYKQFNHEYSNYTFEAQPQFNNVYDALPYDEGFMQDYILAHTKEIVPLNDFNPDAFEEQMRKEKDIEEDVLLASISNTIDTLMQVYLLDQKSKPSLKIQSLEKFRIEKSTELTDGDIAIYIKAIMNKSLQNKLEEDKNTKKIKINTSGGKYCNLRMVPITNEHPQRISNYKTLVDVSSWVVGCQYKDICCHYLNSETINTNAEFLNQSASIASYLFIQENSIDKVSDLYIQCALFNATLIRIHVKLVQVIQIHKSHTSEQCTYNFFLRYPPSYEAKLLTKEKASDEEYLKEWERIDNFPALRNETIYKDQFLRLYLLNNSILSITVQDKRAVSQLQRILRQNNGTIPIEQIKHEYKYKIKVLSNEFSYKAFLSKLQPSLQPHNVWKLKYLTLVLVRYNIIQPSEAIELVQHIQSHFDELQIYNYVLWTEAAVAWHGYNRPKFIEFVHEECGRIKSNNSIKLLARNIKNTASISYIFKILLTPSGLIYDPPTPEMKGRMLKEMQNQSQFFFRLRICEDDQNPINNRKYLSKYLFRKQMTELNVLKRKYLPLGWSGSQLRAFSLWYIHETQLENKFFTREYVTKFLGNFENIFPAAKKAARIGQNFSASWTYYIDNIKVINIKDVKSENNYNFTDGIGKISGDILQKISLNLKIKQLVAIQIRFLGAKGVLVLDEELGENKIALRGSMRKFECDHDAAKKYLDVLDWNRFKPGYINRQIIILLRTLGIKDFVFHQLQQNHIKDISSMTYKDRSMFKYLDREMYDDIQNLEPANTTILSLLKAGFNLEDQPFFRGVLQTMKKNGYQQLKAKSKILIKKSARILGIIDEYGVLEKEEIYCHVSNEFDDEPLNETVVGRVVVTRNPCLNPADIRILECVSDEVLDERFKLKNKPNYFKKLINCVVFPMKGQVPVTATISGSDLDGDNFFITWEKSLIPDSQEDACLIDQPNKVTTVEPKGEKKSPDEQYNQMLDFFIDYLNYDKLGQIDNSHLVHADFNDVIYAKDIKCIELAQIHGKAVDFPKTGFCPSFNRKLLVRSYPDFFEKESESTYPGRSVLGRLYRDIRDKIAQLIESTKFVMANKIDADLIEGISLSWSDQQIQEVLQHIQEFSKDITSLMSLIGIDTEFQIYSGNFPSAQNSLKSFGQSRLIGTILNIRNKYMNYFFEGSDDLIKRYFDYDSEDHYDQEHYFDKFTLQRAVLYYLVSYINAFPQISLTASPPVQEAIAALKMQIKSVKSKINNLSLKENHFGFVWFILPRIILNKKISAKKIKDKGQNKQEKEEEEGQKQKNIQQDDSIYI